MSKKKKKKQQMHVSAGKQENTIKKEQKEEAGDIRMNFYSAMSLLSTVFSAVSVFCAMLISGRGFYYVLQTLYDERNTDIFYLNDHLIEGDFAQKMLYCMYAIAGILVVIVIFSLSCSVTATNPKKRPNIVPAVIMSMLSVVTVVLYVIGNTATKEILATFKYVPLSKHIGFYNVYIYILIANALCSIGNVFGQKYGLKLYKEKGYTC